MKSLTVFIHKHLVIVLWVIAILGVFSFFRSCTTSNQIKELKTELIQYKNEVDSLTDVIDSNFWTKAELDTRLRIHGLETSKRTLYDWNAVVRTVIRPDDRMKQYDEEIEKLRRSLE